MNHLTFQSTAPMMYIDNVHPGDPMQVSVTEFRHRLFHYLKHLEQEEIELTLKGKVIAKVSALEDPQEAAKKLLLEWRKHASIVGSLDISDELDWDGDADDFIGH